jgi:acylpyruvate hydrolase
MRLVTFDGGDGPRPGVQIGEQIVPAAALEAKGTSVRELLCNSDAAGLRELGGRAAACESRLARSQVRLLAPVADPEKIICLGLNYSDHAEESSQPIPLAPMWFAKFPNSLIGDGDEIVLPAAHPDYVDYEAELAVVIGATAHTVTEADALAYVAGAMSFNDVSARDLQLQNPLWTAGKAIDTFAPCGPALVTLDEIDDIQRLRLSTRINGEIVQEGTTSDQIFTVAEVIAWLSRTITLRPGDIIATGTPAGIGAPKGLFLKPGNSVTVEVEGLGAITNPIAGAGSERQ